MSSLINVKIKNIEITDEDIKWVETVLGGSINFDEERVRAIKNLDSVDLQAFPGSGKTTILVAKLAILAKKWPYPNVGICVLSHTNAARQEIEERLGRSDVGRILLSYPHFIGTVHSFFDTYVALPWLRSNGYKVSWIDTDFVRAYRWNSLSQNTKIYLKNSYKDDAICEYKKNIGLIEWNKKGKTKEEILSIIDRTQKEGYFTFGEMLLYAKNALESMDQISTIIQNRFPVLFIDEAQDTDAFQWELLNKAFGEDNSKNIRQSYGDKNQAIYNRLSTQNEIDVFPREENLLILNNSRRFDSSIAKFANMVALSKERMEGTDTYFSSKNIAHTIFLFNKEKAAQVIDEFAQLILNTFTDEELDVYSSEGCHVIGLVHDKKAETTQKQFPKGIYDYWTFYDAQKTNKRKIPGYLIEYFRLGIYEFQKTKEKGLQIDWICKGIRILINKINGCNYIVSTGSALIMLEQAVPFDKKISLENI